MAKKVISPMPGNVLKIYVKDGDQVKIDDELLLLEAMKMEIPILAPASGTVKAINIFVKDHVSSNQELMLIE